MQRDRLVFTLLVCLAWTTEIDSAVCDVEVSPGTQSCPTFAQQRSPAGSDLELDQISMMQTISPKIKHVLRPDPPIKPLCLVGSNQCFDEKMQIDTESFTAAHPSMELVVIRFGEDVSWLDGLPEIPTIVYSRGGSSATLPRDRANLRVKPTPNTGREDDGILRHIIENYDTLPEVTIFLQGWPFLHCAGLFDTVRKVARSFRKGHGAAHLSSGEGMSGLMPISRTFYQYSVPKGLLGLARNLFVHRSSKRHGFDDLRQARDLFTETCEVILNGPCPETQWVAEGAQWAVSRERIHVQPKHVYERALALGNGEFGKFRGLVLEALWPVLWGAHGWSPGMAALQDSLSGKHGPRKRPAHGPFVQRMTHTLNGHCVPRDGSAAPLWSCESRMAFCELQWRASAPLAGKGNIGGRSQQQQLGTLMTSTQFLEQRTRFHMNGRLGEPWEMLVHLEAPLLVGLSNIVEVDAAGVWLRTVAPASTGTQWHVIKEQVDGAPRHLALVLRDGVGRQRYLACDAKTGVALVSPTPATWRIAPAPDGYVRLETVTGAKVIQIASDTRLQCVPFSVATRKESTFSMHLAERVS